MKAITQKYAFVRPDGGIIISKPKSCLLLLLPENKATTVQNYMNAVGRGYDWDKRSRSEEDKRIMEWLENIYNNL